MSRRSHAVIRLAAALLFATALLVPANAGVSAAPGAKSTGASLPTLRFDGMVGTSTWAASLDPATFVDTLSFNIVNMIDAALVKATPSGKVIPDLASKWTISKNHKVYTFFIRKNARFSNGDPVTAEDAVYSYTRELAKSTASPQAMQNLNHIVGAAPLNSGKTNSLAGIKAIGSRTVRITLDAPIAYFLSSASQTYVLDKRVVQGKKATTYLTTTCSANVAAGPFKPVCRNNSSDIHSFYPSGHTPEMTLVPNPDYYGKKPRIRVVMDAIADTQTNYSDYQANGIDVTGIPTSNVAGNKGKQGFIQFPTLVVWYLSIPVDLAPFTNVHCRLAVAYAIDEKTIDNDVLHGTMLPIHDVVPKGVLGYYSGSNNPQYNPAKAKAELAKCPGGIHNANLAYQHTTVDWDNVYGRALPAMLSSVGISVHVEAQSFNDWLKVVTQPQKNTNTGLAQDGLTALVSDPWSYCTLLLHSHESFNSRDYSDPKYDRLVDKANITFNAKKRAALYAQAQHIALSSGTYIPMGQQKSFYLVKPWVHGLVGAAGFDQLAPKGNDWSNVTVSAH